MEVFRSDPTVSLVFGNVTVIDKKSRECRELKFVPFSRWALIHEGTMLANQAAFWRRELFFCAGLLDISLTFCFDYEFFLRTSLNHRFKFIRRFLGAFRVHEESKSTIIPQVGSEEHTEVLRRLTSVGNGPKRDRICKRISTIRRTLYYIIQGDLKYLVRGLIRRCERGVKRSISV